MTRSAREGWLLGRLVAHRYLVVSMARRQFQIRYRQSAFGLLWAVVPPLVTVGAATLVFHQVARIDTGSIPYPVFAFSALVPWSFFATCISTGVVSVSSSQPIIARLAFPRAVLPISVVGLALVDLFIAGATFVVFAYATGNALPVTALWFPVLLVIEIVLAVGFTLLLSALNVFARDIRLVAPFLVSLLLLLTPVLYPLSSVPDNLRTWYQVNPMTGLVVSFRAILIEGAPPNLEVLLPSIVGAVLVFALGTWYFGATENRFADVI